MRIFYSLLLLFFAIGQITAQDVTSNLVVSDSTYIDAIISLEKQTGYQFFFLKDWLPDKKLEQNVSGSDLDSVLENLLANTNLI